MGDVSKMDNSQRYGIILADPPWAYYGDPNKDQAAGKHYQLMSQDEIASMDICSRWADISTVLFLWATCPYLDVAIEVMKQWGFYYRGVGFVWVKINKKCIPINGQGVRPTVVKPTTELVLVGTTCKRGRPWPLLDESVGQYIEAPEIIYAQRPNNVHSRKPDEVRIRIDRLYDASIPRIELFARQRVPGWDAWGIEAPDDMDDSSVILTL